MENCPFLCSDNILLTLLSPLTSFACFTPTSFIMLHASHPRHSSCCVLHIHLILRASHPPHIDAGTLLSLLTSFACFTSTPGRLSSSCTASVKPNLAARLRAVSPAWRQEQGGQGGGGGPCHQPGGRRVRVGGGAVSPAWIGGSGGVVGRVTSLEGQGGGGACMWRCGCMFRGQPA